MLPEFLGTRIQILANHVIGLSSSLRQPCRISAGIPGLMQSENLQFLNRANDCHGLECVLTGFKMDSLQPRQYRKFISTTSWAVLV